MMWSPRRTFETPGPTSSTTPAASCPSTMGRGRVQSPLMMCQSLWQTPVAITRTRASPACGPCCSTSTTSSGVFALYRTAAFIPAPPREPMNAERPVARGKSSRIRARAKARPVGWGRLDTRRARVVSSGRERVRVRALHRGRGAGARQDLPASIAILAPDQYYRGYTLVVSKTHATELYHLDEHESTQYFRDMLRVAAAVAAAFRPRKMNYEVLEIGRAHVHW